MDFSKMNAVIVSLLALVCADIQLASPSYAGYQEAVVEGGCGRLIEYSKWLKLKLDLFYRENGRYPSSSKELRIDSKTPILKILKWAQLNVNNVTNDSYVIKMSTPYCVDRYSISSDSDSVVSSENHSIMDKLNHQLLTKKERPKNFSPTKSVNGVLGDLSDNSIMGMTSETTLASLLDMFNISGEYIPKHINNLTINPVISLLKHANVKVNYILQLSDTETALASQSYPNGISFEFQKGVDPNPEATVKGVFIEVDFTGRGLNNKDIAIMKAFESAFDALNYKSEYNQQTKTKYYFNADGSDKASIANSKTNVFNIFYVF